MISEKKYMEEEWVEVKALKAQFPGNTDVLTREEKLLEFVAHLHQKHDVLPKAHLKSLFKVMIKNAVVDKCLRRHGTVFDQKHVVVLAVTS